MTAAGSEMSNTKQVKTKKRVTDHGEVFTSEREVNAILTESPNPGNYWKVLKTEGNESVTNCNQLKMQAADGKFYKTDVADTGQLFRLIQSIPPPQAEPFKL